MNYLSWITICAVSVLLLAILLGIVDKHNIVYEIWHHKDGRKCIKDVSSELTKCRPKCSENEFSLFGMNNCHPWLDCNSIRENVHVTDQLIGNGAVKLVKLGRWKGHDIAVSFLRDIKYKDDFLFNIRMHKMFNRGLDSVSDKVVQLLGFCEESQYILITEYHPLGSAEKVKDSLNNQVPMLNSISARFSLCLDFVTIVTMLHNHDNGKRVFCDANDPKKALSQFLLSSDLHLLLNDMDALPLVNEEGRMLIKCGQKELNGDFVAPEQIWPYEELPFIDSMMPGYTEKVDIWKFPDVFNYLMEDIAGSNKLKLHLFNIHAKCRSTPELRPSAKEVLHEYEQAFLKIFGYQRDQHSTKIQK